ncbi:MAG: Hemolysin-type calcium-binding region protein, partial [Acidimicrobiaceae bacterium]|nr:Hemolysin-type calcium-binding region protein [Acidimicrobiaceae bacterium]
TVTVPAPTSTNTTFVSATSSGETVAVGATSPGTIWASVSGFTVFDASGVTSTKSIAFTTDGSIAGISFTGNGANSALTFSGTNAVDVAPSGAGGGTATDGLNTVTYAGIDGTIATDGSGTLTLPALTGAVAFAASGGDTSVSVGGTAYGNFGAGFTSFSAAAATGTVTLSSDGSATVTFTGNGGNTTLSITGSGTLTLASTADAGTYTGTATTTFMGVGGTITGVSTASVHLPGSGTVRVTVGTSSLTVSPGSGAETLSGFTTFAAEGTAATTFTTDGSLVGLSFTGNGVHTTIVFSGANPVDISPTSAGGGTATLNSTTLTYAGIGGTITGGAGTNTITVPTPTSGDITFVNLSAGAESVAVGTVAPGTTWAILSGFRVFDASAAVGSVDFTTDGSLAVTITGNGANSTLAVQPSTTTDAVTVELADSSSATTTVLIANEQTTSITHLLGAITTTGSGTNTVILPTLTGTLSFGTVNSVTQVADSGTTVLGSFGSGFGAFNLSSVTGAVALSTDGSTNETYTGNGTSTTITVTGTGTLTLGTAAGAGTYVGTGTTSFTGVGGTITGVPGAVVDLPGTGSVTVDALSTVLTVNSGSGPDTLSGFTTFTAEGSATTTFSTDGSVAGLHFIGNGASTVLTFSGGSAVDLSPTSAGGGTATDGSSTVVYSGIGGMITGGSGTNTVTVPTPGVGNTTFVAIAGGIGTLSVGASAPTTTLAKVGGFTVYAASGASGAIQFSTDGSLASLSLVGNGAGSSLVVDRPGVQVTVTLANSPSSASTVAVAGAQTSSFTEILGTITTDGLGKVVLPSPTGTLSVTATSPTVSVVNGVTTLGTFGAGFTTFDASAATGSVAFAADASLPDLDFIGNGTPSSISYASIGSGGVGVTFCLGTTSTANFANAPCGSSSTDGDTFSAMGTIAGSPNNDTFVAGASNLATLIVTGGGGSDTIDFSNSTHLVTVNLNNATNSETVAVAGGSQSTYTLTANNMENVVGADALGNQLRASTTTPGILVGGAAGDNLFIVTGGTNIINGGLGQANGISLSNAASAVNLDLLDGSFQQTGGAGLLLVVPGTIQSITGSPFGGTIVGGFGTEFINGAATAGVSETLDGGAGSVDITAGSGIETLIGGAGGGALNGGSGTDTYVPGGGTFTINPGSGTSILDLSSEPAAMNVNLGGSATLQLPGGGTLQLSAGEITGGWITGTHTGTINSPSDFLQVNGSTYSDVIVANGGTDHITSAGPAIVYSGAGADTITCTGPGCTVDYQLVAPNGTSNQGVCINLSSSATGSGTTAACDGGNPANAVNPNSAYKFGSSTTDTLGGVTRVVGSAGGGVDTLIAGAAGQTLIAGTGSTARLYASAAGSDYLDGSKAANVDLYGGSVVPPTAYSGVYTGGAFGNIFGLVSGAGNNTFVVGTGTDTVYAQMLQYNAALPLASAVISGNNTIISTVPVPTSGTPTPFSTVTIYGDPSDSVTWPSGTVVQPTDGKLDSDLYWIVNVAKTSGNQLEDESVQTIVSQRAAG